MYATILCPVLILTIKGDPAHPVSTAEELSRLLPNSNLHIAKDYQSALDFWPGLIATFLQALDKGSKENKGNKEEIEVKSSSV